MTTNRRQFLAGAGALGFASALLPGKALAYISSSAMNVRDRDYFSMRTGDWFYLHDNEAIFQDNLELVAVMGGNDTERVQQFSLFLRSYEQSRPMPSGTYAIAGERFDIYVKHTHEEYGRQFYLAEFALLR